MYFLFWFQIPVQIEGTRTLGAFDACDNRMFRAQTLLR